MEDYDKEQVHLNELTKILSDKRRLLRDEEAKLHEIERKIRDKQFNERTIAERLKNEYDDLRNRFEQMALELRFSIEDELKIYARLLDELMKKNHQQIHQHHQFSQLNKLNKLEQHQQQHSHPSFDQVELKIEIVLQLINKHVLLDLEMK